MDGASWFKNAVIYHILIDRFAGYFNEKNWEKPEFIGGNIPALIQKIPYLKDLGVTTLWISPFYKTSAYHGYHITDFYSVDPHFGTTKDIEDLISAIHQNNMYIIADFVPNHVSKHHPFFKEAQKNKTSPYYNWFSFTQWPKQYQCFLSVKDIPKINLHHPDAKNHIIKAALYWLEKGFDGYRIDHVIGPSQHFLKEFSTTIKSEFPNTILIGEAWMQGIKSNELSTLQIKHPAINYLFSKYLSDTLLKQYINILDGVLDFSFQQHMKNYCVSQKYSYNKLITKLHRHYKRFPNTFYLPTFLDNHDMDRFLFSCNNSKEKLKEAISIQFKQQQPAIIYYGTEIGMSQQKSVWGNNSHGDIQARQPMNWDSIDSDLFNFYKKTIKNKKNN
jgi:glycosidase